MINGKLAGRKKLLDEVLDIDIITKLINLFNSEDLVVDYQTGLVTKKYSATQAIDHPWLHIKGIPNQPCAMYQLIALYFRFVPTHCLNCWKVVIKPRTLHELFQLYDLMVELDYPSKCGIERRHWVNGNYGGYFYTRLKQDGIARRNEAREIIHRKISKGIPVYLKRFCTEFEMNLCPGKSLEYKQPKDAWKQEKIIFEHFDINRLSPPFDKQADVIMPRTIRLWIQWAWERGDPTAAMYNDGKPVYIPPQTYND